MKQTPHHVESGEVRRNFKKTLNRNQSSAASAEPTIPLSVATAKIPDHLRDWNRAGILARRSALTLETRKRIVDRFANFLADYHYNHATTESVTAYFDLLRIEAQEQRHSEIKPSTELTYFSYLRAFFRWAVKSRLVDRSPMEPLSAPLLQDEEINPFTRDQQKRLIAAARKSHNPLRNESIVRMLIDNGLRVSELCSINVSQIDWDGLVIRDVAGKGSKKRSVPFGIKTAKVLLNYIENDAFHMAAANRSQRDRALFLADRGMKTGDRLTRFGIGDLIEKLSLQAGIVVEVLDYSLILDNNTALERVKCRNHLGTLIVQTIIDLGGLDVPFEDIQQRVKNPHLRGALKTLVTKKVLRQHRETSSPVRCSPHTFRHSFGIAYMRLGRSPLDVKRVLGHKSFVMVNRYTHYADHDLARMHGESSPSDAI